MKDEERKQREAEFHDHSFASGARDEIWSRYYGVSQGSFDYYEGYLADHARGSAVLEYGCGVGASAHRLVDNGAASVTGIDISPVAVEQASARARAGGYESLAFRVMDAENLDFPSDSFDLICGTGILHHLDIGGAYSELSRVLGPGGSAIFLEPLGHNPLINLYRRRTPEIRTPDEHPLRIADLDQAAGYFGSVTVRFFHLLSMLALPLRDARSFGRAVSALDRADRALFRAVPYMRRHAWQVVMVLRDPRPVPSAVPAA
jgi:SAM-dependent methyltransferase